MTLANATLAVTGSTGQVGGRVARRLADAGVRQRLLVREMNRAPKLDNTEVAQAAYGDFEASRRALDGVETVFMVSGSEDPHRLSQHITFVDAAVAAGVERLVYLSFVGAAPDATFTLVREHWATEQHIRGSGLRFAFLRDNIYLDFLPAMAGEDGVIRGPAGDGRLAAVAQDDIADVAAVVLREPGRHDGASYDLTGPEALSLHEAAALLSRATGRTVTYHPETIDEAYASRARYGAPEWQVDAWVSTYTAIAAGELATVSEAVSQIAGHSAIGLEELLRRKQVG